MPVTEPLSLSTVDRPLLPRKQVVVFTDLDGSLLDHHTYDFAPAVPVIGQLADANIPLVCCSSKTFAEIVPLRQQLGNESPFIVENGAAVYLPAGYFEPAIEKELEPVSSDYFRHCFCEVRQHWLMLLEGAKPLFPGAFTHFRAMGLEGIIEATGLDRGSAALADEREFGEPVQWLGHNSPQPLIDYLQGLGGHVLQGGRFLHLSGACSKGKALQWLVSLYERSERYKGRQWQSLAIGDSQNDAAMLAVSDVALLIPSPVHPLPEISGKIGAVVASEEGPAGWAKAVNRIFGFGPGQGV